MAVRFRAQFTSDHGTTYTIHIHDEDHTGAYSDLTLAPPGFTLQYHGGQDAFHPYVPSSCSIPFLIEDSTGDTFLSDLATADEGRFRVVIRLGELDTDDLYWVGLITMDNIRIYDEPYPYNAEIQAVDGLQLLSRIKYAHTGSADIASVLLYCLAQCGTSDLWGTEVHLKVIPDVKPDEATYADPFDDVKLMPFQWTPEEGVYITDMDCEQVLTQIARCYNSRIFQSVGAWQFHAMGRAALAASNPQHITYTTTGTKSFDNPTLLRIIQGPSQTAVRLAGWSKGFLPPVSSIERPLIYGEGVLISNANVGGIALRPTGSTDPDYASYTFTSENTFPANTTFNLRGLCDIVGEFNGSTTTPATRVRVNVELRVGGASGYYLKRSIGINTTDTQTVPASTFENTTTDVEMFTWADGSDATWSSTSASYQWGSDVLVLDLADPDYTGGVDDSTAVTLDFETPGIPSELDGEVRVAIWVALLDDDGTTPLLTFLDSVLADFQFTLSTGDGVEGTTAIYTAEVSNGATEVRKEDPVYFGSQLVFTGEPYYNPAEFYNVNGGLPDWISTKTTTAEDMHEVCLKDQLYYFQKPRQIWQGAYMETSTAVHHFGLTLYDYSQLTWYVIVNMSMSAMLDTYEVELHQVGVGSSAPTSDVTRPRGKFTPVLSSIDSVKKQFNRASRDLGSIVADTVTDVANINRTTDSQGGDSSILLQYLGDVKISGPSNGQLLQYNSAAGRWANVTPTTGGVQYHGRYDTEAGTERSGATANVEIYYTARPDGDGYAESETSDSGVTDTINRTLYYSTKYLADPDTTADWTEYTTQPADNATFATAKAALLAGLNETDATAETRGTLPLSLKMVRTTSAVTNLLLDSYPNAAAAFSVRKLDKDYTGYCMKVRRASDDAEADIGFDTNGDLDTSAIATHCGASAGYVSVWYDQANIGGTANNATQSTAIQQPQIYNGTAVITDNSKAAVRFTDPGQDSNRSVLNWQSNISTQLFSWSCVAGFTPSGAIRTIFHSTSGNYLRVDTNAYVIVKPNDFDSLSGGTFNGTQKLNTIIRSSANTATSYQNGSQAGTISTLDASNIVWGNIDAGMTGTAPLSFNVQEIIIWTSDKSSDRTGIESDINTYFSIYTP